MGTHLIVTGASSGIGAALAHEMSRRGYAVGCIARRQDRLDEVTARIRSEGGEAHSAVADVCDPEKLQAAISTLEDHLGPCEVLVANAGVGTPMHGSELDLGAVRHSFEVNFFGALNALQAVLGGMLERERGQLVVISSVAGSRGLPASGPYSASKAAVSTFWESMRIDLRERGLHFTTIHPGFVESEMTARNNFPMPFILSTQRAAEIIADAIQRRRRQLSFPWPYRLLEMVMRLLPNAIFDRIVSGRR